MAYAQSDLEAVQTAILALARGERVTSVSFSSGTSIDYGPASLPDLRALEASIASSLGTRRRSLKIASSKGL